LFIRQENKEEWCFDLAWRGQNTILLFSLAQGMGTAQRACGRSRGERLSSRKRTNNLFAIAMIKNYQWNLSIGPLF